MSKRNNLAYIFGMLLCITGIFSQTGYAQKTAALKTDEAQKQAKKSVLQNYLDISALPIGERGKAFSDLSVEDKASIFRFHLAFQLMKRPDLNNEQREMIIESIASISPDSYGKDIEITRAKAQNIRAQSSYIFSKQEIFEIFASLGGSKEDIGRLQKYQDTIIPEYGTQRKRIFSQLSVQDKSDVMRTHMIVQMAERYLAIEKLKIMGESIVLCTSEVYLNPSENGKSRQSPSVKAIFERIKKSFEKEEAMDIFASLGGKDGGLSSEAGYCRCLSSDDWCAWWGSHGSHCVPNSASNPCNPIPLGDCGTWLTESCNGTCVVSSSDKK